MSRAVYGILFQNCDKILNENTLTVRMLKMLLQKNA